MENMNIGKAKVSKETPLFSTGEVWFASYIGGPLAATYVVYYNFQKLHKENEARNSLIIGILATVFIFGSIYFIPDDIFAKVPNSVIPLSYTLIAAYIVQHFQGKELKAHFKNEGIKVSAWKTFWVSILGLLITFGVVLLMLLPVLFEAPFKGEIYQYGTIQNEIYYEGEISEEELNNTGQVLKEFGLFDDSDPLEVKIETTGSEARLYFFILSELLDQENISADIIILKEMLNSAIPRYSWKIFGVDIYDPDLRQEIL
jgi:hypothetical protein